jgi:hypothetical protein
MPWIVLFFYVVGGRSISMDVQDEEDEELERKSIIHR